MNGLRQDISYAVRQLRKSPGFATVAILSLALGIGANTAIFTLINGLILKSLPVRHPEQLVVFGDGTNSGQIDGIGPGPLDMFPYDFFKQVEAQHDPLQDVCATGSYPVAVSLRTGPGAVAKQALTQMVSGSFFRVLGVEPVLGRPILPADADAPGRNPVAVLSHRYWSTAFGADPSVIGRTVTLNATTFTVIGVTPENFFGVELNADTPDMWVPVTMQQEVMLQPSLIKAHGLFWLHVMGRQKEGVSTQQAQAWVTQQLQQFMVAREGAQISDKRKSEIAQIYVPLLPGGRGISHLRDQFSRPLYILMGIVILVLVIACANLANFLLAKSASREREISTRMAMGASRARVLRHVLTEALMLSSLGGLAGLLLAFFGTRMLVAFVVEGGQSSPLEATPDLQVLAFTFGVSLLTGALFGIAPAWRASRVQAASLSSSARTASGTGARSNRLVPRVLVAGQVALSLMLLVGAGLFVRTLQNLKNQNFGFNRSNVLLADLEEKLAGYKADQLVDLNGRIIRRLEALPGVKSASLSGGQPMMFGAWRSPIFVQGYSPAPNEDISTSINRVSTEYFSTVGIPVLQGRAFGAQDSAASMKAVIVNQTVAKHFFPLGDAVGHQFTIADPSVTGPWQIVGVVADTKYNDPREQPKKMIYLPLDQLTADDAFPYSLQVRSQGDPSQIENEVRAAMAEVDPGLPVLQMKTISEYIDLFMENERLISQLATFFSGLALALACIGLYGIMTHNVVRRTNEIGIRIALGAQARGILWMVLGESLALLAIGVAVGVPATLAATQYLRAQLFGLSPFNVATILAAVATISVVILTASYLPAHRAAQVDPMVALRYE